MKNEVTYCKLGARMCNPFTSRNLKLKKIKSVRKIFVPHKIQSENSEYQVFLYNSKINKNNVTNVMNSKKYNIFSENTGKKIKKREEIKINFNKSESKTNNLSSFKRKAIIYSIPMLSCQIRRRNKYCSKEISATNILNSKIYYKATLKRDLIPKLALMPNQIEENENENVNLIIRSKRKRIPEIKVKEIII